MAEKECAVEPGLEAHCRRVAAWSLALERTVPAGETAPIEEIMELAEALDQHFAWEPYGEPGEAANPAASAALASLRISTPEDLDRAIRNLPVFPAVAQRALGLLVADCWTGAELEAVARMDQTLAAHVLSAANSLEYGARRQIMTLAHAITFIGASRTSRILYAAAVKPLFSGARLHHLWEHSLIAAQAAEALAEVTGRADSREAFLAGLVHDIGRLAMMTLPDGFQSSFEQLTEVGCEQFLVERVLSGFSHAQAGARALQIWNFPEALIEAVEFHHEPEKSQGKLASILYLVEHWTDSGEDVASAARLKLALDRAGISEAELADLTPKSDLSIASLFF